MKNMNKTIFLGIAVAAVALGAIFFGQEKESVASPLDGFAQCLSSKGVVMYGADWCPHCQSEKKKFGASFQYVSYVECPDNPKQCLDAGVEGYPTWTFPDGKRLTGDRELSELSEASGCVLPE
jgi:thiol-disulfide isomerase/thioredoxin